MRLERLLDGRLSPPVLEHGGEAFFRGVAEDGQAFGRFIEVKAGRGYRKWNREYAAMRMQCLSAPEEKEIAGWLPVSEVDHFTNWSAVTLERLHGCVDKSGCVSCGRVRVRFHRWKVRPAAPPDGPQGLIGEKTMESVLFKLKAPEEECLPEEDADNYALLSAERGLDAFVGRRTGAWHLFRGALTGRDALGDDFRSGQIKCRLWPSAEVRVFGADATVEGLESVPGAERPADGSVGVSDKETREDDADSSLSRSRLTRRRSEGQFRRNGARTCSAAVSGSAAARKDASRAGSDNCPGAAARALDSPEYCAKCFNSGASRVHDCVCAMADAAAMMGLSVAVRLTRPEIPSPH
jgi:hypothetical protein